MPRLRRLLRSVLVGLVGLVLGVLVVSGVQVLAARVIDPPVTLTMLEASWDYSRARGELLLWEKEWKDLDELGDEVPRAMVSSEDARFWLHDGFDWAGICRAVEKNRDRAAKGDTRRVGGSTITQQVARNVFLWQGQSYLRKGLETLYTLWIELLLPKERILELYVNVAETGVLTFGAEAGARRYFDQSAAELSAEEAGRLASVLPSPRRWGAKGERAAERAAWIGDNPAPWPGQPGFEEARARHRETAPGPWDCL